MDLDATVTIARTGADLVLGQDDDYELVSVTNGGRTWRRRTIDGPYMHGRALLGAVLDTDSLSLVVRCKGTTWIEAQNRYQDLLAAVTPLSYDVTVDIEGNTVTYACEPADVAAPIDKFKAMANLFEVSLTIPVDPT